jgi:hypothetical protein
VTVFSSNRVAVYGVGLAQSFYISHVVKKENMSKANEDQRNLLSSSDSDTGKSGTEASKS